jgi:uncharacterized protein YceK
VQTTKLIFLAVPVLLSGCATPLLLTGVGIGSLAVSETTGKSVTDHAVSTVNNQDCRVGRAFRNQEMCQPKGTTKLQVVNTGVTPSTVEEIQSRYR